MLNSTMRTTLRAIAALLLPAAIIAASVREYVQQSILASDEDPTTFDANFDDFVEEILRHWHVPGLSIAIVDHGHVESKVSLPSSLH